MPKINHLALYCLDLEKIKDFYIKYFQAISNENYLNPNKGFESYFLSFGGDVRLEIMRKTTVSESNFNSDIVGLNHLAISVGSKEKVDLLTKKLIEDG